ncbi:CHAT domain-containing protein [Acanthopleuribacter pedis]|uniref:CHAT domain-containing protein n=1 Tax=Acanthopleuribacter pedis TaxID=442870 RepID=A0A8J7QAN8_9BACT|nr:CHAT domain-containing protein [Acanthopleuribacter pedis]MBO1321961.1 CHAT domain-containing protein [Acanthopleuribacter pedis]
MNRLLPLLGLALLFFGCEQENSVRTPSAPAAVPTAPPAQPLAGRHQVTMAPGDTLRFTQSLTAGQALVLHLQQAGVDLRLALHDGEGQRLATVNQRIGAFGPETLWFQADRDGVYQVEIAAVGRLAGTAVLTAHRPRSEEPGFQRALRAFAFTQKLQQRETTAAVAELEEHLALWRQAEHPRQTAAALYALAEKVAPTQRPRAVALLREAWVLVREHHAPFWAMVVGNRLAFHEHLNGEPERSEHQLRACLDLARLHDNGWWQAFLRKQMGRADHDRCRHVAALENLTEAAARFEGLGDRKQAAETLVAKAETLFVVGRLIDAADALDRAELLNEHGTYPAVRISILMQRGWLCQRRKDYSGAEAMIRAALALKTAVAGEAKTVGIRDRLGTVLRLQARLPEAEQVFLQALAIATNGKRPDHAAVVRINLARVFLAQDRLGEIDLENPLATLNALGDAESVAEGYAVLAERAKKQEQSLEELAHLEAALAAMDRARGDRHHPRTSRPYIADRFALITRTRDLLLRLDREDPSAGYRQRALALMEKVRARTLREQIHAGPRDNDPGAAARAGINRLEQARLAAAAVGDAAEVARLSAAIREQLLALSLPAPPLAAVPTYDLSTLRTELLNPQRRLVVFALGKSQSRVLVIGPTSFIVHDLPPRAILQNGFDALAQAVTVHNPVQTKLLTRKMGKLLLEPWIAEVAGKTLLLVRDDGLHTLPFSLLRHPVSDRYLIEEHRLVDLPSASIAVDLLRRARARGKADLPGAVFADPVYPEQVVADADDLHQTYGAGLFQPLPMSAREAEEIRRLAAGTELFLGRNASPARLTNPAGQRRPFLHFAVHGLLHEDEALSGLALSADAGAGDGAVDENGILRCHQLEAMSLPVDLVVLSACRTALGATWRGETPIGPGRAFLAAGATHVMMTAWEIDDHDATVTFMTHFYTALLQQGQTPTTAWRHAQRAMIAANSDPAHWAGFLLSGPPP